MPRAGLTSERVTVAAAELADEVGLDRVTLTALAKRFGVATPSLYSHVRSTADVRTRVALLALEETADRVAAALAGVSGRAALAAMGGVWRTYAVAHPGRYAATRLPLDAATGAASAGPRHAELSRAALRGLRPRRRRRDPRRPAPRRHLPRLRRARRGRRLQPRRGRRADVRRDLGARARRTRHPAALLGGPDDRPDPRGGCARARTHRPRPAAAPPARLGAGADRRPAARAGRGPARRRTARAAHRRDPPRARRAADQAPLRRCPRAPRRLVRRARRRRARPAAAGARRQRARRRDDDRAPAPSPRVRRRRSASTFRPAPRTSRSGCPTTSRPSWSTCGPTLLSCRCPTTGRAGSTTGARSATAPSRPTRPSPGPWSPPAWVG